MITINEINQIAEKGVIGYVEIFSTLMIVLCALIIFTSILINFIESKSRKSVKKEKKSVVETGTMFAFFIILYLVIRFGILKIEIQSTSLKIILVIFGTLIIVLGTIFNVLGRLKLKQNWANQIRIYKNQTLIKKGVYGIVRHPLYASLIWVFYGASLVYHNILALLLNSLIFIPFMYYRAKQEEKLLIERFKEYKEYINKVGMFFPKIKL